MRHYYAKQIKIKQKLFTEIFGHDGTNNYMNQNLDMKGKSISLASQLSSLTYVYTPTLRATNIEFWGVANIVANDFNNSIRFHQFHCF